MQTPSTSEKFSRAIVRTPCRRITEGLTSADLGKPNYDKALAQHAEYAQALQKCGLAVTVLPADERYPDSVFVEDTAVLTARCAVVTRPGAESRQGEVAAVRKALAGVYDAVEAIEPPGTLEGGDVMAVKNRFYIGLSKRTNQQGARQMIEILRRHGMVGTVVPLKDMLHLKTGVNYLENGFMTITGEFLDQPVFRRFKHLPLDPEEAYAANAVWINGKVLVAAGFPKTNAMIEAAGYETIPLDVSEFRKIDGGLSCLSLRF